MIAELVELYPAVMAVPTGAATLLEIEGLRPRAQDLGRRVRG